MAFTVQSEPRHLDRRQRSRCAPTDPALYENSLKRLIDIVGASVLLLAFAPAMILLWLLVRLDGGPGIYRQQRLGARGVPFDCLKFRSMCVDAEAVLLRHLSQDPAAAEEWRANQKLRNDRRITRIGSFLRRSSLDELPQLWNVLRGDMSLVGPRPIVAAEVARYGRYFSSYESCRPGITGLWQVSGRCETRYSRRVALDHKYCREWRLLLDLRIVAVTPIVMVLGSGAY